MPNDKSYHLYIQRHLKILMIGMLVIFTIVGLLLASGLFQSAKGDGPPRFFGIFWIALVSFNAFWILSLPHTIVVRESGQVEFVGVIRRRQTSLREIQSIKPYSQLGFMTVKTGTGKFRILNPFDEFHDFIIKLKAANPSVELRGC